MPLALVLAVTVLTHLAFAGARVAVALLALHLGASPAVVGILAALFPALPMFFSIAAGRAIDRIGVGKPMLAGALAVAGGCAVAFVWPTLEALYAVSVVVGSGAMLSHIASHNAVGAIGNRLYTVSGDGQSAASGIEHSAVPYNEILQVDLVLK